MNYWIYAWMLVLPCLLQGQKQLTLNFDVVYQNQNLLEEKIEHQYQSKPIVFTRFRCYLTKFELWKDGKRVWEEADSYHLIDEENLATTTLVLTIPEDLEYHEIRYQLGIDSATNVSGAMGGDLDPTKGMYWAWNSGYINFKLEGRYEDCPTRKNKFQFHLGGYSAPFASVQNIKHSLGQGQYSTIKIAVRVDEFLSKLNLTEEHSLMRPSQKAVDLSILAASIFSLEDYE